MTAVVLFDGVCHVCNGAVDFLLRHDRRGRLRFAALQSEAGEALLAAHGVAAGALDTFRLVEDGRVLERSDAALRVAALLGWPWRALVALRLVPRPVRDAAYDAFARRRLRWFGARDTCRVPTPAERARFL